MEVGLCKSLIFYIAPLCRCIDCDVLPASGQWADGECEQGHHGDGGYHGDANRGVLACFSHALVIFISLLKPMQSYIFMRMYML